MQKVLQEIHAWLDREKVSYRSLHHVPTPTSEDSARVRGEALETGGKALLLKIDDQFALFVMSAARKLNSKAIKKHFGAKKLRFANASELKVRTGLVPGSVPPFGRPIFELDLYVDQSILANEKIAFNAGSLTDSVIMPVNAYLKLAKPEILEFTQPA
ncbi:MAG: YbaK/EbsC family protein [Bacteroidota bacterium]